MFCILKFGNTTFILFIITLVLSCGYDKNSNTLDTENAKELTETEHNATIVKIDSINSIATWIGSRPTGQDNGFIPMSHGELSLYNNEIIKGHLLFDIKGLVVMDMQKDTSSQKKLYNHLMSADFFAADSFPQARFDIIKVLPFDSSALSEGNRLVAEALVVHVDDDFSIADPTHIISGNLKLRGISRHIAFPSEITFRNGIIRTEAKLSIDRSDWKISYDDESNVIEKAKDKFIHNTVHIGLSIRTLVSEEQ